MLIAGIDEVGRGCLAGPVVTCAVVFESGFYDSRIKDSKKLSKKKREELYPFIIGNAVSYGIGVVALHHIDKEYIHPNKADDTYIEVSAASIIAKVYRDNLMAELAKVYKGYLWEKNAGYGTKEHIAAIKELGITEVHRKSFLKNFT